MKKLALCAVIVFAFISACSPSTNQTLPTLFPTPGQDSQTAETPVQATAEATQPPGARATLPPTWTPAPDSGGSADNGASTPTPESLNPPGEPPTEFATLVVCGTFVADRGQSTSTFITGNAPQVFWTKVETAFRYRLRLLDDTGTEIFVDFPLDTTYTFQADLFEQGKVYGWSVYPEDSLGQQMCGERGAELFPQ